MPLVLPQPIGMIGALSQVLDLPKTWVIKEAASKLAGTFVKINGQLTWLDSVDKYGTAAIRDKTNDDGLVIDKTHVLHNNEVVSLEVWLPQSGVYKTNKGAVVMLTRLPLRQWKRSFSPDVNYLVKILNNTPSFLYSEIIEDSCTNIWVEGSNIYYYDKLIGTLLDNNKVYCINQLYEQELLDWIKYGKAEKVFTHFKIQTSK